MWEQLHKKIDIKFLVQNFAKRCKLTGYFMVYQ